MKKSTEELILTQLTNLKIGMDMGFEATADFVRDHQRRIAILEESVTI